MRSVLAVAAVMAISLALLGIENPEKTAPSPRQVAVGGTAENLAAVAGYMLESGQFDETIADWLGNQSWPLDGTQESIDLITTLLHVDDVPVRRDAAAVHQRRVDDAMAFLRALAGQAWYRDGFDAREKRRVNLTLGSAAAMDSRNNELESFFSNPDFRWVDSARYSLDDFMFELLMTEDGRELMLVGFHNGDFEPEVREAFELVKRYYAEVEEYARPIEADGIVVAVDVDLQHCGVASYSVPVLVLHPACVEDGPIVHELIHVAATPTYFAWFNEGIASFGAAHIATVRKQEGDPCASFDRGLCSSDLKLDDGNARYRTEAERGTRFISDVGAVIGTKALSKVIKDFDPDGGTEQELFNLIRSVAPAGKVITVESLIRRLSLDLQIAAN